MANAAFEDPGSNTTWSLGFLTVVSRINKASSTWASCLPAVGGKVIWNTHRFWVVLHSPHVLRFVGHQVTCTCSLTCTFSPFLFPLLFSCFSFIRFISWYFYLFYYTVKVFIIFRLLIKSFIDFWIFTLLKLFFILKQIAS